MKLIAAILLVGMTTGPVSGQNPNIITNTRTKLNTVQQKNTADSNEALGLTNAQAEKSPYSEGKTPSSAQANARSRQKTHVISSAKPSAHKTAKAQQSGQVVAVENAEVPLNGDKPDDSKAINITGRRDPFVSPVVSRAMSGSGCSTGKRCLAIDQINLRGVVKSDDGMIAVVVNALDKAYFLHENDPVFNGYVVRITGDSVIFKESVQDKFGKPFTREVTKKIFTPAV
jgi:type II secretory pathway component PulC